MASPRVEVMERIAARMEEVQWGINMFNICYLCNNHE